MKKYRWIWVSALYLILCLFDGLLTYINTPDLKMEANPLVKYLGLGWGALFFANAIGLLIFILAARGMYSYQFEQIEAKGFFDYYMKLFFGENYKPSWFWYKFVKNRKAFWGMLCYSYVPAVRRLFSFTSCGSKIML